jgi:hypothetical protein
MPGARLIPAIAGIPGQCVENSPVHHTIGGNEKADAIATIIKHEACLLSVEHGIGTGL